MQKIGYIATRTGTEGFTALKCVELADSVIITPGATLLFENNASRLNIGKKSRAKVDAIDFDTKTQTTLVHLEPDFFKVEEVVVVEEGWSVVADQ
jgi:hypothetical protein